MITVFNVSLQTHASNILSTAAHHLLVWPDFMQHGACVCVSVTSGYLSTVHRPDNEVILLHVPEVAAEADKNSQYTTQCLSSAW